MYRSEYLGSRRRVQYLHGLGERTGFPDGSFDLVNIGFVIHECPPAAIQDLATEAMRLLRPNGVLAITDNNPRSADVLTNTTVPC